jgi:hypothetical protein
MPDLKSTGLLARWLLMAGVLMGAGSASALKVDLYAIGHWTGGDTVPVADAPSYDRPDWPGMALAWYNEMGVLGHTKTGAFIDGNQSAQRFCDLAAPGCQDFAYVDWPDAAIIAAHGMDGGDYWAALMRKKWSGESYLRFGTAGAPHANPVVVGDRRLKFLHASSCQSLQDNYFPNVWSGMQKADDPDALHLLAGFHGYMWISSAFNNDYKKTADWGHVISVARSWVLNQYRVVSPGVEQCPTAYTVGTSGAAALSRLLLERYNAVGGSPKDKGAAVAANWYAWIGFLDCNPTGAAPFKP